MAKMMAGLSSGIYFEAIFLVQRLIFKADKATSVDFID